MERRDTIASVSGNRRTTKIPEGGKEKWRPEGDSQRKMQHNGSKWTNKMEVNLGERRRRTEMSIVRGWGGNVRVLERL